MNITVINGTEKHGVTYRLKEMFLAEFKDKANITEYYLPKDCPSFCIGCLNCTLKGENICKDAEYIKKIDAMGGAVAAIEQGYMQGEMSAHAYEDQRDIETKRSIVVGVNKFVDNKQLAEQDVLTADLSVAERQIAKVEKMKDGRDQKAVDAALTALKQACAGEENLMPYLIDAVKTYATLGEICGVMKEIFGEYRQDGSMF